MQIKNAMKKVFAFGAGLTMVGATMMGAMAASYTLASYPAPFVKDGKMNALIIIGDNAKAEDVIGATDIVARLQYEMTTKTPLDLGGKTSSSVKDGYKLATDSDGLYKGDTMSARVSVIDNKAMPLLADTTVTGDNAGEVTVRTRIKPGNAIAAFGKPSGEDVDPQPYINWKGSSSAKPNYTLEIEFSKAVEPLDLADEAIVLFGKKFTFAGSSSELNNNTITLYGGGSEVTVDAGESQSLEVAGQKVSIEVQGVNTDATTATVNINGAAKQVSQGHTYVFNNVRVYIKQIYAFNAPVTSGGVNMFVGTDKVIFENGQAVQVGSSSDTVDGTLVTFSNSASEKVKNLKIEITPTDMENSVDFQYAGKDFVDPVFGGFKVLFSGLFPAIGSTERDVVNIFPDGDQKVGLEFTNRDGGNFKNTIFYTNGTSALYAANETKLWADTDQKYVVKSTADYNNTCANIIGKNDFFIVDDGNGFTHVVQLKSITNTSSTSKIMIKEAISGANTEEVTISSGSGKIRYNGKEYNFDLNGAEASCTGDPQTSYETGASITITNGLVMDAAAGSQGMFTQKGALLTPFGALTASSAGSNSNWAWLGLNLTEETSFNEDGSPNSDGNIDVGLSWYASDLNLYPSTPTYTAAAGSDHTAFSLVTWDSNSDKKSDITPYGTYVLYDTSTSNSANVRFEYPTSQASFDIFFAPTDATATVTGAGGNVDLVTINRLEVGAAKLASEVSDMTAQNVIVVGGPCVNDKAAILMGEPTDCTAGFTQGKAMIKLFNNGQNVALLVAGYSALDTRRATDVLANFDQYKLTGMEMEVSAGVGNKIAVTEVSGTTE